MLISDGIRAWLRRLPPPAPQPRRRPGASFFLGSYPMILMHVVESPADIINRSSPAPASHFFMIFRQETNHQPFFLVPLRSVMNRCSSGNQPATCPPGRL